MQPLCERLEQGGVLSIHNVASPAHPYLCAVLASRFPGRCILAVTSGLKAQESFFQDIETWRRLHPAEAKGGDWSPLFYPDWEVLPHQSKLPHADTLSDRLDTLVKLAACTAPGKGGGLVVASVSALMQPTFLPGSLRERIRHLRKGDTIEPGELAMWLESEGYEPEAQVTQKGELSLRGGILDVFPLTGSWPVRLEFFGNELESLREFDPVQQTSRGEIESVILPPAGELGFLKRSIERAALGQPEVESQAGAGSLLHHLGEGAILVLCEPDLIEEHAALYAEQIPAGHPLLLPWNDFLAEAARRAMPRLLLGEFDDTGAMTLNEEFANGSTLPDDGSLPSITSLEHLRPLGERAPDPALAEAQRREFFNQIHRWLRRSLEVVVTCNNDGERQRFCEIWAEYGFTDFAPDRPSETGGCLRTRLGSLSRGFVMDWAGLVVVTDAEIFGRYKVQRPRRMKSPHAAATRSLLDIDFAELEEGDLVVHLQHGIGRFCGLGTMPGRQDRRPGRPVPEEKPAGEPECLIIEYAPGDSDQQPPRLYVPVSEAHLVSKYVGAGKARPPLNTLGGTRWVKAKEHAERAVRDLAGELLSIQAARASQSGTAFGADTPWQREFESAFLYEETRDQLKAIEQAKADMESTRPMDRLVCGDVGFGKTEVAIRAAFKAVMAGKQVAMLVPTTVLAQQHYNTLRERMADYPIQIDLLSRFRSRREQQKVLENLASGRVDIVVGTHRLVQDDVQFKDLGLVVIDEEQRFGVLHKERFKLMRKMVDVLTLSATPIPRTLYLALTGARDMSTIETPPQDRLPVQTVVSPYDERLIREAIQRELNREGQVFFLHNRVTTIDAMALKLKALVPKARILVGHGQMDSDDLERVMTAFVNGEADVLLSTTIIESGLDIPNANTIIIDRADRFGLSELYQLRGRVGRYKHQAYAYLLIPRHAGLLADARKRISALKQYSTLGSGFKIAMRDLEIRGAGNLLGAQQSGHITAVGFDLYCKLLKQSVRALKGERVVIRPEVQVRLDFVHLSRATESGSGGVESPVNAESSPAPKKKPAIEIEVPRETAYWRYSDVVEKDGNDEESKRRKTTVPVEATLPVDYLEAPERRIEIYRRLAEAEDLEALEKLRAEVRDRFGPLPRAVELLWMVTELKQIAGRKGVTLIESREDKVMLKRNGDWITVGGMFPRLAKKDPAARLKEIRRLLQAI